MTDVMQSAYAAIAQESGVSEDRLRKIIAAEQKRAANKITKRLGVKAEPKERPDRSQLPALPAGLKWPTIDFDESPYFQKKGGIGRYLTEEWRLLSDARIVNMAVLRQFYPEVAGAIDSLRRRGGSLPEGISIPQVSPGSGLRRQIGTQSASL